MRKQLPQNEFFQFNYAVVIVKFVSSLNDQTRGCTDQGTILEVVLIQLEFEHVLEDLRLKKGNVAERSRKYRDSLVQACRVTDETAYGIDLFNLTKTLAIKIDTVV